MAIQVFGQGAIQTAYVAFTPLDITGGSITLVWPNTYVNLPYTQDGINYNVLAASMTVNTAMGNTNTITLPDATEASVGANFIITNIGAASFNLLKSDGSILINIPSTAQSNSYWVQLTDNSTAIGVWQFVQFGAGTSQAQAAALAGNGLVALGALLNTNIPVQTLTGDYTVVVGDRAKLFVWQGGDGTVTLPAIGTIPQGFYVSFNNEGTGTLTIAGNGVNIDANANLNLGLSQSLSIISDGTQWWTLGLGQASVSTYFLDGTAANPSIAFQSGHTTGLYYSGVPFLGFTVSGNQVGQFTQTTPSLGVSSANLSIVSTNGNLDLIADGLLGTGAIAFAGTPAITISNMGAVTLPAAPLPLGSGGTGANLTASNGGIFYSTATAAAVLAGTATANQILLSGANAAPSWSASTITLAGNFQTIGANSLTLTTTGITNVKLPTAGTLISAISTVTSGQATLNGTIGVMISTAAIATTSIVLVTHSTGTGAPTLTNLGTLVVGSIVANTSFTVYSSNALDTATVNWQIINP